MASKSKKADDKKSGKRLFDSFWLLVKGGKLQMRAMDSIWHRIGQRSSLSVIVDEEGDQKIPVKNPEEFLKIIKGLADEEISLLTEDGISLLISDHNMDTTLSLPP